MARSDRSRYRSRLVTAGPAIAAAQRLRHRAFHGRDGLDQDPFDSACTHLLIEDRTNDALVGTLRFQVFDTGAGVRNGYSAQFYDLERLSTYQGLVLELGRVCRGPDTRDPDILRLALAVLGRVVVKRGVSLVIGCSSFAGVDPAPYTSAFRTLLAAHQAPDHVRPGAKAPQRVRFADLSNPASGKPDAPQAGLPPLLRAYVRMGGWVSDHAVVDAQMGTLHVFTGLDIAAIPPRRARSLWALAQ